MGMWKTVLLAGLWACNGDQGDKTSETDDTDTSSGPPSFTFVTSVRAKSFTADIAPEVVEAHQASSALLTAMGVAAADAKVQDRLGADGAGPPPPAFRYVAPGACWSRPQFPMFSFTLDYSTSQCAKFGMTGGIEVEDHPSGPLLFNFLNFEVQGRTVGGTMAFDTRDAYPSPMFWQLYHTDAANPGLDNPVPIGITIATESAERSFASAYSGGSNVDFFGQKISFWGTLVTGPADHPITVIHGGTDPEQVPPDDPRDAEVLSMPLNWAACRCPTSGVSTYDMPLSFTEVVIDIDDLEDVPDDVDDPDLTIPIEYELVGKGILTHTGCGEYDVEYVAEEATLELSTDRLLGVLSFACDTLAINDIPRCEALLTAARKVDRIDIQVPQADATATALTAVETAFDTSYCKF